MSKGLKLVMAVSRDGILALGPDDRMFWTGSVDKKVFRLLTMTGGVVGAGWRTLDLMPRVTDRRLIPLSRQRAYYRRRQPVPSAIAGASLEALEATRTLGQFAYEFPGGWLAGGPTVAYEAVDVGLVEEAHICRVDVDLRYEADMKTVILDRLTPRLRVKFALAGTTRFPGVSVEHWRRG